MLFYPDQYFYQSQQPRRQSSQRQSSRPQSRRQAPVFEEANPWEELFYGAQQPFDQYAQASPRRRASYMPDEYVVVDEDELAALRAYRESKRRQNQEAKRREAEIARRRAEEERKLREAARRDAEVRMRAQIEANAKAAAREYFRRKQAQQAALQQAQYAERQQRQQLILEQLRNQFGFFNIQSNDSEEQAEQNEQAEQAGQAEQGEEAEREAVAEALNEAGETGVPNEQREDDSQDRRRSQQESGRASQEQFDPIRVLLEALSPFPFIVNAESSDEEEDAKQQQQQEEELAQEKAGLESDGEGPTCETASEDSEEPTFVEFIDPSVRPPVVSDPLSDDEFEDESISKKDRSKERQAKDPKSRLKKQKHNDRKKTDVEVVGLLHALEDDLTRIRDGYNHISSLPKPADIKEAVSRIEGIKIGYSRSEEIYNRLDQVRVGKDERKRKHQITADAVALADKFDDLLKSANAVKEELHGKNPSRPESPRHVTLEEVADESD